MKKNLSQAVLQAFFQLFLFFSNFFLKSLFFLFFPLSQTIFPRFFRLFTPFYIYYKETKTKAKSPKSSKIFYEISLRPLFSLLFYKK